MEGAQGGSLAAQPFSSSAAMGGADFVLRRPWEELISHDEAHRQPWGQSKWRQVTATDSTGVTAYESDLRCEAEHWCHAVKNA